eukprot:TRINITY_DN60765_c0_g1_i1.p1 TRINITY_DN60765_c0_g1~~TRINITY_DN60765_c0_g1_i1.p1  ORF type:complete len:739 (+),score=189.57 TRINITY_DN60765_c0_g1_i1:88-2304(+)
MDADYQVWVVRLKELLIDLGPPPDPVGQAAWWRLAAILCGAGWALYAATLQWCRRSSAAAAASQQRALKAEIEESRRYKSDLEAQLRQAEREQREAQVAMDEANARRGGAMRNALQSMTLRGTLSNCFQRWRLWAHGKVQLRLAEAKAQRIRAEMGRETEAEARQRAELQRLRENPDWQELTKIASRCGVSNMFMQWMDRLRGLGSLEDRERARLVHQEVLIRRGLGAVGRSELVGLPSIPLRVDVSLRDSHLERIAADNGARLWEVLVKHLLQPHDLGSPTRGPAEQQLVTVAEFEATVQELLRVYHRTDLKLDLEGVFLETGRIRALGGWAKVYQVPRSALGPEAEEKRSIRSGCWLQSEWRQKLRAREQEDLAELFIPFRHHLVQALAAHVTLFCPSPQRQRQSSRPPSRGNTPRSGAGPGSFSALAAAGAERPSSRLRSSSLRSTGSGSVRAPSPHRGSDLDQVLVAYKEGPAVVHHEQGALVTDTRELPAADDPPPRRVTLSKGERVIIEEIAGRRARISSPVVGWLSLRTTCGRVIVADESSTGTPRRARDQSPGPSRWSGLGGSAELPSPAHQSPTQPGATEPSPSRRSPFPWASSPPPQGASQKGTPKWSGTPEPADRAASLPPRPPPPPAKKLRVADIRGSTLVFQPAANGPGVMYTPEGTSDTRPPTRNARWDPKENRIIFEDIKRDVRLETGAGLQDRVRGICAFFDSCGVSHDLHVYFPSEPAFLP